MKTLKTHLKTYLIVGLITLLSAPSIAQTANNGDRLKSLVLLSISRHVNWPADKGTIRIGVLGENYNMVQNLKKLVSERKYDKKIEIASFSSAFDVKSCDMLFVTNEGIEETLLLSEEITANTLVITDSEMGQAMSMVYQDGRMSFRVNEVAMSKSQYKISSDLLALATIKN